MISNLEALENLTELQGLSENEKRLALQILQEFSASGSSQKYQELKYRDYKEIPVDIETFLTDDNYLGKAWKDATGKSKLLDTQEREGLVFRCYPENISFKAISPNFLLKEE